MIMGRTRILAAAAALATMAAAGGVVLAQGAGATVPRSASSTVIRQQAVCRPLVRTIRHWWPVLLKAAPEAIPTGQGTWTPPAYPWGDAAGAVLGYLPRSSHGLGQSEGLTADSIVAVGIGSPPMLPGWRPLLRRGLRQIRAACPALPESIVSGPMPA